MNKHQVELSGSRFEGSKRSTFSHNTSLYCETHCHTLLPLPEV